MQSCLTLSAFRRFSKSLVILKEIISSYSYRNRGQANANKNMLQKKGTLCRPALVFELQTS